MRLDVARGRRPANARRPRNAPSRRPTGLWRSRRTGPGAAGRLAGLRLVRGWPLLLAVGVGMLVAVVLVCTVPLYTGLVANVQLQRAIHSGAPDTYNIQAVASSTSVSVTDRDGTNAAVTALGARTLRAFVQPQPSYYVISDSMLLIEAGEHTYNPARPDALQATYTGVDFASTADHLPLVAGALPRAGSANPQALVTKEMADTLHIGPGDALTMAEFGAHSITSAVTISGVWQPSASDDLYWNGRRFAADNGGVTIYPVLVSSDVFFSQLAPFKDLAIHQNWIFYTRADAISTSNMLAVSSSIGLFRSRMNGDVQSIKGVSGVDTQTGLDHTIADIQSQQALLALPLYVIVVQIVGLALLFVAAMAALLVEGQSQEITTLKSRGASGSQLLTTFTAQGLLLGLIAAVAGPFLAALLAIGLIRRFVAGSVLTGAGISSSYLTQLANPTAVILPALVGALLGVGAVIVTAWQSAQMDVLAFRREQARPTRVPFWKRYYLDLALVALCLIGYLELGQFGAASTRQALGGGASPLLLVTPALLLLAGALIVLRVLPLGAQAGARTAAKRPGLTALLAFAQVERNPGRYSRMTLLLVLAVGLGLFALTFDASLTHNVSDRAAYAVGADARLTTLSGLGNGAGDTQAKRIAQLPGVAAVSPAYRSRASTTPDEGSNPVDVLAIDPATFATVADWRSDFADTPLPTLLQRLRTTGATGRQPALVSADFAAQYHVKVGDAFTLTIPEASDTAVFSVAGIVHDFPTLYPQRLAGSFIVTNMADYFASIVLIATPSTGRSFDTSQLGPNEFWLKLTGTPAQQSTLLKTLAQPAYQTKDLLSLRDQIAAGQSNPVSAGMRGLLLVGAVTAALLAVLGSIIQSLLATRQRARQFAVLRTIGMAGRELTGLLLSEQVVVYLFGLVGGTILGLLLTTATLPFLQFSDTTVNAATLGIPPYTLTFTWQTVAIFYAALLVAFGVALLIAARYANSIGLGKALRLGED
jgi:ABC-type lipoprotein release transport system permease subunit